MSSFAALAIMSKPPTLNSFIDTKTPTPRGREGEIAELCPEVRQSFAG